MIGGAIGNVMGIPASFLTLRQISVIVSQVLIEHGAFWEEAFNQTMKQWAIEQKMLENAPSTRRYLTALVEVRNPKLTSGQGMTNGSTMRASPHRHQILQ